MSGLHWAARKVDLSELKSLIESGAEVDQRNQQGNTALFEAAGCGALEGVRLLLAAGARVDGLNGADGQTALMEAARHNQLEVCQALIEAGASALTDANGETPLHHASSSSVELIWLVGSLPGQSSVKSRFGETPRMICGRRLVFEGVGDSGGLEALRQLEEVEEALKERDELARETGAAPAAPRRIM